mgnify:CR=1 FL=1
MVCNFMRNVNLKQKTMFDKFKSSQISLDQQRNLNGGATGPYKAARSGSSSSAKPKPGTGISGGNGDYE